VIVVDASVVGDALVVDGEAGAAAARALAADDTWAAPAHLTIEVLSVLRKHYLRGRLSATRAGKALGALQLLEFERVDISLLLDRIWELKENLSCYDAAYVAAAELLEVPLLTGDIRLTTAPGPRCQIITPGANAGAS
jgi:predicted nucleic acid-binding protein